MEIWVPHTFRTPETAAALAPYKPKWVPMDADEEYPRFLKRRWDAGWAFINVEHDVVFHPGALEDLWSCPHQWCAFSYGEDFRECTTTLGCVKFSAEFITATAGCWDAMLDNAVDRERNPTGLNVRGNPKWMMCDSWLTAWARYRCGIEVHQHWPAVANL